MNWIRAKASIALIFALSGCFHAPQGWDVREAKAVFEAVPTVESGEYEAALAGRLIRLPEALRGHGAGSSPDSSAQITGTEITEIRVIEPPLGSGEANIVLPLKGGCADVPSLSGGAILLAAAFRDPMPDASLIHQARTSQMRLADCLIAQGAQPQLQIRTGQVDLEQQAQIVIYDQKVGVKGRL